jgi:drug/metabolite transporter (DMT)-like permease
VVFVLGIAAAFALALGYVMQQRAVAHANRSPLLSYRLLWDLMHLPVWWGGIAFMVLGQILGGLALNEGTVAQVEPLLSTSLLFAFVVSAFLSSHRVRWFEVAGAVMVSAALGVFIAVGNPHSSPSPAPNRAVVVLAVGVVAAVVFVLVNIGRRRGLVGESILLATGAGLLYGLQDAGTRSVLIVRDHEGTIGIFFNPWMYIVIASAIVGILLSQSAFRVARLDYSLPPIAVAEPVAGLALGVSLLGDVVSVTVLGLAVEAACLATMIGGVILIGRSASLANCEVEVRAGEPALAGEAVRDDQVGRAQFRDRRMPETEQR